MEIKHCTSYWQATLSKSVPAANCLFHPTKHLPSTPTAPQHTINTSSKQNKGSGTLYSSKKQRLTTEGFEPSPIKTRTWNVRLRPLGQVVKQIKQILHLLTLSYCWWLLPGLGGAVDATHPMACNGANSPEDSMRFFSRLTDSTMVTRKLRNRRPFASTSIFHTFHTHGQWKVCEMNGAGYKAESLLHSWILTVNVAFYNSEGIESQIAKR
jgi:hypothetical protein